MSDQPRWPRGTPVAPSGRGPGGGRFRGDWADALSSRMLPSLRDIIAAGMQIPEAPVRAPEHWNDPPTPQEEAIRAANRELNDRLTQAVKQLLEGVTDRDGQTRVADVGGHYLRGWSEGTFMTQGHISISGGIVGPRDEERGYFRISAHLDDGPDTSGKWTIDVDRFYVHLSEEESGGPRGFLGEDKRLRPGQGGGLATEVLRRVFDWGRESGFERATIGPSDTGFYAWAALGFDFEDFESRKIAAEGLAAMSVNDLIEYGLSPAAARRDIARVKLAAAQVLAGTMSAHRLSQLGRRRGQGRDDMWLGWRRI